MGRFHVFSFKFLIVRFLLTIKAANLSIDESCVHRFTSKEKMLQHQLAMQKILLKR
jgi:hypothetical protein